MTQLDAPEFTQILTDIHGEWMQAEACIKQAEQVNNAVVIPAIKELRYAGRCLINGINLILSNGDISRAKEYLLDAKFDANRARHDAVDAMVSKIAIDLESAVISIGPRVMIKEFPEFVCIVERLNLVRNKIVISRTKDKDRNGVYSELERDDVNWLVDKFREMKNSYKFMTAVARAQDFRQRAAYVFGIVGFASATVCVLLMTFAKG